MKYSSLVCAGASLTISVCFAPPPVEAAGRRAKPDLTAAGQRHVKAFTQDVVSVGVVRDFEDGRVPNDMIVWFGIYQTELRTPKLVRKGNRNGEARVAASQVQRVALQYFGKGVRHQSVGDWKYRGVDYIGWFELFEQSGDEQIKRWRAESGGPSVLTVYADYINSMADTDDEVKATVKTRMALRRVSSNGQSHYNLTAFKYFSERPW